MEIPESEIFAYRVGRKVYCKDCIGKQNLKDNITSDDVVLREDVEENGQLVDSFFCRECKRLIR